MSGPVNVGIVALIEVRGGIDHSLWLVSGGRVIEPNQRFSVDLLI